MIFAYCNYDGILIILKMKLFIKLNNQFLILKITLLLNFFNEIKRKTKQYIV